MRERRKSENERRKELHLQRSSTVGKKKTGAHGQGCVLSNMLTADSSFRAKVVGLILSTDTEEALQMLSRRYNVAKPNLRVGMPKRHSKKLACYLADKQTIYVSRRETLCNPHVILHEFYHHLRNFTDAHGGIEKYAQRFAENYLQAYRLSVTRIATQRIEHENEKQYV